MASIPTYLIVDKEQSRVADDCVGLNLLVLLNKFFKVLKVVEFLLFQTQLKFVMSMELEL